MRTARVRECLDTLPPPSAISIKGICRVLRRVRAGCQCMCVCVCVCVWVCVCVAAWVRFRVVHSHLQSTPQAADSPATKMTVSGLVPVIVPSMLRNSGAGGSALIAFLVEHCNAIWPE